MNLVAMHQFDALKVARAQSQVAIAVPRHFHQQARGLHFQSVQRLAELLGLGLFHIKGIDHDQLAVGKFRGQRRTQRPQQLLARKGVVVRARLRSMHRAAMPPQWRTDGSHAGAPRTLLLPQFLARAGDQLLVLGGVRAGTLRGAVMLHRFPQQVFVDRAENLFGEIERADLLPAQIMNIDSCHMSLPYSQSRSWLTTEDRRLF